MPATGATCSRSTQRWRSSSQAIFAASPQFELLSAIDAPEGLRIACRERPDLILLDLQLPHMDGYAVLRELQLDPAARDIPVIAVTAAARAQDVERGKAAGFAGYVTKPIALSELMQLIDRVADDRQ